MINKKYLKLIRSRHRSKSCNFIYNTVGKRIIDSIDLLDVNINDILEIGVNDITVHKFLNEKYPSANFIKADICESNIIKINNYKYTKIDLENFKFKNKFDLIYSNSFLNLSNNFENVLLNISNSLNKNGFFIASLPDIYNGFQLRNSLYKTDLFLYKGAYQRTNPTLSIEKILDTLKKLNFDIPTINSDNITIEYSLFENLMKDMRETNLSYCFKDKKNSFENKIYFKILEKFYKDDYFKGKFNLDLKFNIISAWKK